MKKTLTSVVLVFLCCFASGTQAVSFRIIALPDTQYYARTYPEIFIGQTQWIADNVENLNIAFVTHLGDIVQSPVAYQWYRADYAMSNLDGVVPYSACLGNHDIDDPSWRDKTLGSSWYLDFFGPDRFEDYGFDGTLELFGPARYEGYPWYGGSCNVGINHYQIFTAGGITFLHLNLEMDPSDAAMAWAQGVLDQHPTLPVIYSTHAFLSDRGVLGSTYMDNVPAGTSNGGQLQWNKFVRHNDRIFMTLNGHYRSGGGEARATLINNFGNEVFAMCSNYQGYPAGDGPDYGYGGNGYLRILEFDIPNNKIYVKTYSTRLNSYRTGSSSQFTLNINFSERFPVQFAGGDGTAGNPYQISTADQLLSVNLNLSAHYTLVNDIVIGSGVQYAQALIAPDKDSSTQEFVGTPFTGSFSGNSFSIRNLKILGPDSNHVGLFGCVGSGGVVTGLNLLSVQVTGNYRVGTIAGLVDGGAITHCQAVGTLNGGQRAGGIVGDATGGSIQNCRSAVAVNGSERVGGLAGSADWDTAIVNSNAAGRVTLSGTGSYAGGLVGRLLRGSVIENCYASGEVSGYTLVGGLVGDSFSAEIRNAYATGRVSGSGSVGGLVGRTNNADDTIADAYATGHVVSSGGDGAFGGLVGLQVAGDIERCHAAGNVSDRHSTAAVGTGGLVGRQEGGRIENCYATGNVIGFDRSIGGLVGHKQGVLRNSYATGNVSGRNAANALTGRLVGGLVGRHYGVIENCYATGAVEGQNEIGGLIGRSQAGSTVNDSYAIGAVLGAVGETTIGGVIGQAYTTAVAVGCFWDAETSGVAVGPGNAVEWETANGHPIDLTGLTTAAMKTVAPFIAAGWDFDDIWHSCDGFSYARLFWQAFSDADINLDGAVDAADLGLLIAYWLDDAVATFCVDLYEDGVVNLRDFAVFASEWVTQ